MPESCPDTDSLPSRIAALVHTHFDGLPKRSKPVLRDGTTAEWIPMTGIVLVKGANTPAEQLTCVTVTTGAKCLPASQIPQCNGLVLHDCHAETLAMRAFNYWLLSECRAVLNSEQQQSVIENGEGELNPPAPSPYIRRRQRQSQEITRPESDALFPPFEICPDVDIYMYCTCAPCGDASMELVMAAQDDPTPWALPNKTSTSDTDPEPPRTEGTPLLSGRGHFSQLGIVRRKPARADAESTKSKSCSDKIALRQVTSLLSYESSLLVAVTANAYVKGLIMPEEEISKSGCERCFGGGQIGRMRGLNGRVWPVDVDVDAGTSISSNEQVRRSKDSENDTQGCHRYSYAFRPFEILSIPNTQLKSLWAFRKPRATDPICEESKDTSRSQVKKTKPGTISAVWVRAPTPTRPPNPATDSQDSGLNSAMPVTDNGTKILPVLRGSRTGLFESIINGVRQGHKASGPGPGIRGASALCRARMWEHWRGTASSTFQCTGDSETDAVNKSEDGVVEETLLSFKSKEISTAFQASTYREFKKPKPGGQSGVVLARRQAMNAAKDVLDGWVPNDGDEGWGWRWNLGELFDARGDPVVMDPKGSKKRKR
ncbi:hypothetical protein BDW72DRAFT_196883 [Aspergillus terricola var. indicus]